MAAATSTSPPAVARIRQPSGLTTHLAQTGKPGADPRFAEPANRKLPRSARRSLTEPKAGIRSCATEWNKHAIRPAKAAGETLKPARSQLAAN